MELNDGFIISIIMKFHQITDYCPNKLSQFIGTGRNEEVFIEEYFYCFFYCYFYWHINQYFIELTI